MWSPTGTSVPPKQMLCRFGSISILFSAFVGPEPRCSNSMWSPSCTSVPPKQMLCQLGHFRSCFRSLLGPDRGARKACGHHMAPAFLRSKCSADSGPFRSCLGASLSLEPHCSKSMWSPPRTSVPGVRVSANETMLKDRCPSYWTAHRGDTEYSGQWKPPRDGAKLIPGVGASNVPCRC